MVHLDVPGPDEGVFSTEEVRSRDEPTDATSRTIAFPKNHYREPPHVAGGFKLLDLSHEAPIRANLCGSDLTKDSFKITLETWNGGVMYAATAQWLEHKFGAKDTIFGQIDTMDIKSPSKGPRQQYSTKMKFRRPFASEPPEVICWLNRIDMVSDGDRNYRIRAYATNVTQSGFTAHIDTWGDSILNGAAMCFVAFPANKKHVASGRFSTSDVRAWHDPRSNNSAVIRFKQPFRRPPVILVALHAFDMAGNADLRIRVDADEVTEEGFRWHLDTWDDSTLYSASASYIALGFS